MLPLQSDCSISPFPKWINDEFFHISYHRDWSQIGLCILKVINGTWVGKESALWAFLYKKYGESQSRSGFQSRTSRLNKEDLKNGSQSKWMPE